MSKLEITFWSLKTTIFQSNFLVFFLSSEQFITETEQATYSNPDVLGLK